MKNVRNAHFLQIDNNEPQLIGELGAIILPSAQAYEQYKWTRKYFEQKPAEGYFVWIKEQLGYPLNTCLTIASPKISQRLNNLVVLEKGLKSEIHEACTAVTGNLCGVHAGYSKIVLKQGAELNIKHFHSWGKKDRVDSKIDFVLEQEARLFYVYKCLKPPGKLKTKNNTFIKKGASANFLSTLLAKQTKTDIEETIYLNGKQANGISRLRVVADKRSEIIAKSRIVADSAGTGHLDCTGLLLSNNSTVIATPELVNKNKQASLTHEASVGKIAEENLNYLRSRGLTESEAINLIVSGFLGEEEPLVINGQTILSEQNM